MTDDRFDPTAADGELLSAYLAGDLNDAAAADLERRLADEPQLAAALDALADALVALGGFDDVEPPAGYDERLSQRLATPEAPADLAAHRQRRLSNTQWLRIGTVAAVLVAGALTAGTVLRSVGGDARVAMDSAGSAESTSELAVGLAESARPSAPVILDKNVKIADEEALRRRYSTLPEAQALLGVPLDEATQLAMVFEEAVVSRDRAEYLSKSALGGGAEFSARQADAATAAGGTGGGGGGSAPEGEEDPATDDDAGVALEGGGSGPRASANKPVPAPPQDGTTTTAGRARENKARGDRCLDAITKDAEAPLVPVRVETLRYDGRPALSYVLVTSTPGSDELDRTEVWVVRPTDCRTIVFQQY